MTTAATGRPGPDVRPGRVRLLAGLTVAAVVAAADQLTKAWALERLDGGRDIDLFWTLRLHLTFNRGMAFSRGRGFGPVIGVVAIVVVAILVGSLRRIGGGGTLSAVAVGLVIGGAVGNLVDRVARSDDGFLQGAVVDFIDLQWWPVFNLADAALTIGGALLVLSALHADRPAGERRRLGRARPDPSE